MNPNTLQIALENKSMSDQMAREARSIGMQAREDRRTLVGRMDERMQLDVARAAGATVSASSTARLD